MYSLLLLLIYSALLLAAAISLVKLIAYIFTGKQIGEFKEESYELNFIVLVAGFVFQVIFKDDHFASDAISGTVGLTFCIVAILHEKRGCNGLAFGRLSKETGIKARFKNLLLMSCNAFVIMFLCLGISCVFQVVNYCEYIHGYALILLCSILASLAEISIAVLIADLVTGERTRGSEKPYVSSALVLIFGFTLQCIFRDHSYIPSLAQNTVNVAIFVIGFLDKRGLKPCQTPLLDEPQKEAGIEAGRKGRRGGYSEAFLNVITAVVLGFIVAVTFQYIVDGAAFIDWLI